VANVRREERDCFPSKESRGMMRGLKAEKDVKKKS
jgi:hypothetical protein